MWLLDSNLLRASPCILDKPTKGAQRLMPLGFVRRSQTFAHRVFLAVYKRCMPHRMAGFGTALKPALCCTSM